MCSYVDSFGGQERIKNGLFFIDQLPRAYRCAIERAHQVIRKEHNLARFRLYIKPAPKQNINAKLAPLFIIVIEIFINKVPEGGFCV